MSSIIELVNAYRQAKEWAVKEHVGELLAEEITPKLRLQIFFECARDLRGDAFGKTLELVFGKMHLFQGTSDGEFESWWHKIAKRKVQELHREKERQRLDPKPPEFFDDLIEAAPAPLARGERLDLDYAMKLLQQAKPPCYDYLRHRYMFGWSYTDIAEEFGLPSPEAAEKQIKRCVKLARLLIKE